jgi:hypothetical protein
VSDETIIMFDTLEAASAKAATGCYDRFNRYFGADERTACCSGWTHVRCSERGAATPKGSSKREACFQKQRSALLNSYPVEAWGGASPWRSSIRIDTSLVTRISISSRIWNPPRTRSVAYARANRDTSASSMRTAGPTTCRQMAS